MSHSAETLEPTSVSKNVITDWNPEDQSKWNSKLAWTTLWVTTFNLMLGFIIWYLPGAIIPTLGTITGWALTDSQSYWLLAMPGLSGGFLRLLWMILPPIMGTRKMLLMSTALLILPFIGWAWVVQLPEQPSFALLLALCIAAGIGGGIFSGYMPSTSYFFPKSRQGTALGLQAGIGNFGVSVVQFVVPWVIGFGMFGMAGQLAHKKAKDGTKTGFEVWLQNPAYIFIPFAIIGFILVWTMIKSVPVKANIKQQFDIFSNKHTWIMTLEYVLTFGIFSGFAAAFGMLMKTQFSAGDPTANAKFVFLGAFVGSVARILWGPLCDKFGGGIWTVISGIGIAIGSAVVLWGQVAYPVVMGSRTDANGVVEKFIESQPGPSFIIFMTGMITIFFFAGIGNAATFKQMPMIFEPRQAGGVIGWTAAIAAFGPFLFNVSFDTFSKPLIFSVVCVYALICAALAWYYYARPGAEAKS